MVTVTKRNGKLVEFNQSKITRAILQAAVSIGIVDFQEEAEEISTYLKDMYEENFEAMSTLTVEMIGDDLEILLMEEAPRIAKSYILYRQKRSEEREKNNLITKEVIKATRAIDTKEANANCDERSIGGRVGAASDIIQQRLALEYDMSAEVAQAHKDMIVYTHDLNYYSSGAHNCLTIDIGKLLTEGYWTRNGSIRSAGSFRTAAQLIPVIFQTQSLNQFGGVATMHIDYDLAPFVKKSFKKILQKHLRREVADDFVVRDDIGIDERYQKNREYKEKYPNAWDWALEDLKEEIQQGCESLYHNLNTLESRAGSQLPFSSINFGRDTSAEGRLVTKSILEASLKGVGKEHSTPIFPISIFCVKDGVNKKPGDPNYDLKVLALKSLSKRIFPNFANGDCILAKEDPEDIDTIFATMGCRTLTGTDVNSEIPTNYSVRIGRGNCAPATIILPNLAMKYSYLTQKSGTTDWSGFFEDFEKTLILTRNALIERFNYICSQSTNNAKYMYKNETMRGGKGDLNNPIFETMKHQTLAVGFIGIAEMCVALFGESHFKNTEANKFAFDIVKRIRTFCDESTKQFSLNFSCYATPAENLCFKVATFLKKKWGVIEGISDKEFVTNSFHVPVWEKPLIFEKIDFEKPYAELCNGGTITYVEVDGNIQNNLPALEKIVDYAMDKGIPYFAVNLPIDRCRSCGYDSEILGDNCPECGSTDIERLRRITGYLTSSTEYWNKGKRDEESRRVKHNQQNKIFK